jgi:UDP-galactopyranose mutase
VACEYLIVEAGFIGSVIAKLIVNDLNKQIFVTARNLGVTAFYK